MAKQPQTKRVLRYTGPVTSFDVTETETRSLFPGTSYRDLPEDHEIIANLIERRVLIDETGDIAAPAAPSEGA